MANYSKYTFFAVLALLVVVIVAFILVGKKSPEMAYVGGEDLTAAVGGTSTIYVPPPPRAATGITLTTAQKSTFEASSNSCLGSSAVKGKGYTRSSAIRYCAETSARKLFPSQTFTASIRPPVTAPEPESIEYVGVWRLCYESFGPGSSEGGGDTGREWDRTAFDDCKAQIVNFIRPIQNQ